MYHGKAQTRTVVAGKQHNQQTRRWCEVHGWIDDVIVGGVDGFIKAHGACCEVEIFDRTVPNEILMGVLCR